MDVWQPSTLSWSFSRKTHFDSCRRHYFYHRFWGQEPKLRWKLFEMRNLTTLNMLRGQVAHAVIAESLNSLRMGRAISIESAKERVTTLMRTRYMESAQRLWHIDNRPQGRKASDITSLVEHYYAFPDVVERAREARKVAWACLENLFASDFWTQATSASPARWMDIEDDSYPSFDIDGIQVYIRIDFAHSDGAQTIIDWKTGAPSEQDRKQLVLYSLYARSKWDWDPLETSLAAVYLQPEFKMDISSPTEREIGTVIEEVKHSFEQMHDLEPAFGPADIAAFPMTEDRSNCRWCRFQGACEGGHRV
ncbi:MAG: PD-(D/E)XK nuclease family protein [Armatimonadetes bacterium]|nr:PD-(D/E)XK nuclease family protein [Armatimonadota bacterium]